MMEYKVLNNGLKIALKFLIQNGIVIIPKTTHKERMVEKVQS